MRRAAAFLKRQIHSKGRSSARRPQEITKQFPLCNNDFTCTNLDNPFARPLPTRHRKTLPAPSLQPSNQSPIAWRRVNERTVFGPGKNFLCTATVEIAQSLQ